MIKYLKNLVKQKITAPKNLQKYIKGNELTSKNLQNVFFDGQDLSRVDFTGANISGSSFKDCCLDNAKMMNVVAIGTQFNRSSMVDVNFYQANCEKADFRGTNTYSHTNKIRRLTPDYKTFVPQKSTMGKAFAFKGANLKDASFGKDPNEPKPYKKIESQKPDPYPYVHVPSGRRVIN